MMPQVKEQLDCQGCGAHIIEDGKLTCPRCHDSVEMASSHDVIRDAEGRWKCQKCLEHGENPKTLAIGDKIQCRFCRAKDDLFEAPSTTIQEEPKVARKTQTDSGLTKLTTKEYNELLQRWLKEEKKKKRELSQPVMVVDEEAARKHEREIAEAEGRIEALEKAIALNFDPDEFEKEFNVPIYASPVGSCSIISFEAKLLCRPSTKYTLFGIFLPADEMPGILVTRFYFHPVSQILHVIFEDKNARESANAQTWVYGIEEVVLRKKGLNPGLEFRKGTRRITISCNGGLNDRDSNY